MMTPRRAVLVSTVVLMKVHETTGESTVRVITLAHRIRSNQIVQCNLAGSDESFAHSFAAWQSIRSALRLKLYMCCELVIWQFGDVFILPAMLSHTLWLII